MTSLLIPFLNVIKKRLVGLQCVSRPLKQLLDNKLSDIMSKVAVISRLGNWGVGYPEGICFISLLLCVFYFLLTHSKKPLPHVHLSSFIQMF